MAFVKHRLVQDICSLVQYRENVHINSSVWQVLICSEILYS